MRFLKVWLGPRLASSISYLSWAGPFLKNAELSWTWSENFTKKEIINCVLRVNFKFLARNINFGKNKQILTGLTPDHMISFCKLRHKFGCKKFLILKYPPLDQTPVICKNKWWKHGWRWNSNYQCPWCPRCAAASVGKPATFLAGAGVKSQNFRGRGRARGHKIKILRARGQKIFSREGEGGRPPASPRAGEFENS